MRTTIIAAVAVLAAMLSLSRCRLSEEARTEAVYGQYCGACHLAPDPAVLSKELWEKQVLPEMGARLGIRQDGYNPLQGLDMEEAFHVEQAGVYPAAPLIAQSDWERIYNYVLNMAPDSLPVDHSRAARLQELSRFQAHPLAVDKLPGAMTTAIQYDSLRQRWLVGNRAGEWYAMKGMDSIHVEYLFASAVSGFDPSGPAAQMVVEMGYMNPSDVPRGRLWKFQGKHRSVIAENLRRPVFVKSLDTDADGRMEYIVCEFGNRAGLLSLFQEQGGAYRKKILLSIPGTIRVEAADMNADGLQDLVVLAGQGDEGIYLLFNQGKGDFSVKHPIRLPPVYGSSWFELFDYEGDGDLDIALVNGDNADFTYALKPYHGLRLFLNEGADRFQEAFFYPIYGATRLVARDFDQDGDVDFAVTALFPDFERNARESFVYLENLDASSYRLQAYSAAFATEGNWLVMDAGDPDQDGDADILLGGYSNSPAAAPDSLRSNWNRQNVDVMWLENVTGRE